MSHKAIAKDPSYYEEREIEKNEQAPIDISISKEVYDMVYNVVATNFYSTIKKMSVDKKKKRNYRGSYNKKNCLTNLDSWIAFYYQYGRFPGSENFTNVPHVNTPIF